LESLSSREHGAAVQRQPRARTLAAERWRQDPREPHRSLRGEELRDRLRAAARRAGAAAADRRRHARVRDHRRAARRPAHRRPHADLAAATLARARAGRRSPAGLHRGSDEADPTARALLEAAHALPVRPPPEQHRLRAAGHRRVRRRLLRPAVHGPRHAAGARRRAALARRAARGHRGRRPGSRRRRRRSRAGDRAGQRRDQGHRQALPTAPASSCDAAVLPAA
jgi:hypothetical protein